MSGLCGDKDRAAKQQKKAKRALKDGDTVYQCRKCGLMAVKGDLLCRAEKRTAKKKAP